MVQLYLEDLKCLWVLVYLQRLEHLVLPVVRKVLEIQEADYLANFSLSQSLKRQGKTADAKIFQDRAEQIKSNLERLNEITSTAISQRPLDPELHRELSKIYKSLGQEENAKRWKMSAERLDPANLSR